MHKKPHKYEVFTYSGSSSLSLESACYTVLCILYLRVVMIFLRGGIDVMCTCFFFYLVFHQDLSIFFFSVIFLCNALVSQSMLGAKQSLLRHVVELLCVTSQGGRPGVGGWTEEKKKEKIKINPVHENVTNCFLYTTSDDIGIAKLLSFQTSCLNLVELLL